MRIMEYRGHVLARCHLLMKTFSYVCLTKEKLGWILRVSLAVGVLGKTRTPACQGCLLSYLTRLRSKQCSQQ